MSSDLSLPITEHGISLNSNTKTKTNRPGMSGKDRMGETSQGLEQRLIKGTWYEKNMVSECDAPGVDQANRVQGVNQTRVFSTDYDPKANVESESRIPLTVRRKDSLGHPDVETVSVLAQSTFSEYSPSLLEKKGLLSRSRAISVQREPQRTRGRQAFVGVCRVMSIAVPIDIDDEVTNMHGSSLAKLARVVKRKDERAMSK